MQVLLNQQYLIDFESNEIAVIREEERLHLEPRLMQVLEILVERPGTLISREELIERVWENYGGADEALNQAISHLRKALDDQRKSIIVTVPKKGYKLMANISSPSAGRPSSPSSETSGCLKAIAITAAALLAILILVFLLFFTTGTSSPKPGEAPPPPPRAETPASDNSSEENAPVAPPANGE